MSPWPASVTQSSMSRTITSASLPPVRSPSLLLRAGSFAGILFGPLPYPNRRADLRPAFSWPRSLMEAGYSLRSAENGRNGNTRRRKPRGFSPTGIAVRVLPPANQETRRRPPRLARPLQQAFRETEYPQGRSGRMTQIYLVRHGQARAVEWQAYGP